MTPSSPPRLAVALLRRFLPDHEPLTGDLIERFATRRSRTWFWRETIVALALYAFRKPNVERPLRLSGRAAAPAVDAPLRHVPPRQVNLSASPLAGVGGLGLVALGVVVAIARPAAWWLFVPAIVGGLALGIVLVLARREAGLSGRGPSDSSNRLT